MKTAILFSLVLIAVSLNYAFATANARYTAATDSRLKTLGEELKSIISELYHLKGKTATTEQSTMNIVEIDYNKNNKNNYSYSSRTK